MRSTIIRTPLVTFIFLLQINSILYAGLLPVRDSGNRLLQPIYTNTDAKITSLQFLDLDGDGYDDVLERHNSPQPDFSSVYFDRVLEAREIVRVRYFHSPFMGAFNSNMAAFDLDGNDTTDIFVGFTDSLALYLWHFKGMGSEPSRHKLFDRPDMHHPVDWAEEAEVAVFGEPLDLDGDGTPDLILNLRTEWNLFPRGLMGFSPSRQKILWFFPVAGFVSNIGLYGTSDDTLIVFGTSAPANGAVVDLSRNGGAFGFVNSNGDFSGHIGESVKSGIDFADELQIVDWCTYLICLNRRGRGIWIRQLFEGYSSAELSRVADVFDNALLLTGISCTDKFRSEGDTAQTDTVIVYRINPENGDILYSRGFSKTMIPLPYAYSIEHSVVVCDSAAKSMLFLNDELELTDERKLGHTIRSISTLSGKHYPNAPLYRTVCQNGTVRLYEAGFRHFIKLPPYLDLSQDYIVGKIASGVYAVYVENFNTHVFNYCLYSRIPPFSMTTLIISTLGGLLIFFLIYPWRLLRLRGIRPEDILPPSSMGLMIDSDGAVRQLTDKARVLTGCKAKKEYKFDEVLSAAQGWKILSERIKGIIDKGFGQEVESQKFDITKDPDNRQPKRRYTVQISQIPRRITGYDGIIVGLTDITKEYIRDLLFSTSSAIDRVLHKPKNQLVIALNILSELSKNIADKGAAANDEYLKLLDSVNERIGVVINAHRVAVTKCLIAEDVKGSNILEQRDAPLSAQVFYRAFITECKTGYSPELIQSQVYEGDDILIRINEEAVKSALRNIVENALQASQEASAVEISGTTMSIRPGVHCLQIIVEDHGKGIPDDRKVNIFEPGFTYGKEYGTGLGLSRAWTIIQYHNGNITFKSEAGKGTTFTVSLPESQLNHNGEQYGNCFDS